MERKRTREREREAEVVCSLVCIFIHMFRPVSTVVPASLWLENCDLSFYTLNNRTEELSECFLASHLN